MKVRISFGESVPSHFAVRWRFTEAGANKALVFWEAHNGQTVRTIIGDYVSPPTIIRLTLPSGVTNYTQWGDGWLKHRTDKMIFSREKEADTVYLALKGNP